MSVEPRFLPAADALAGWRDSLLSGERPTVWPVGTGELASVELGPGTVLLVGGMPGAGKTALVMQWVFDALRLTPSLRCLVCNVEMTPAALLDRQLARLSGVDLTAIRHRQLTAEHAERIDAALATLEPLADRLAFLRPPFDLANVAAAADAFGAELIVLDYIQRIKPPGDHADRRGAVDAVMDYLRQFADAGTGIIAVSAVGRGKDARGRSSYAGDALSLASFRESSELEFGADAAYLLTPDGKEDDIVHLRCLKNRHGEPRDVRLHFDRPRQRFTPATATTAAGAPKADAGRLQKALADLWARTPPASDDDQADGRDDA